MLLNPKHLTLNEVLSGRLFRIPEYQRAYAWGPRQRQELFADIEGIVTSDQDHFMATTVCLLKGKTIIGADQFQTVEIVDGQQRLTSLIILLKAIEKALSAINPAESKIKREISELILKGDDQSLILLATNHDTSSICSSYLRTGVINQHIAITQADHNLVEAARESEAFVAKWGANNDLVALVAILRNRLSMIVHELTDERIVYRVFEVLNSRGLDVKWVDKLKSQLMALAFQHADDQARREALNELKFQWQQIYTTLGLESEIGDEALRFAGSWRAGSRPNKLLGQQSAVETLVSVAAQSLPATVNIASSVLEVVQALRRLHDDVRLRAVTRILHARFVACAIVLRRLPLADERALLSVWERVTFRIFGLAGEDARSKVGDYVRLGYDILAFKLSSDLVSERLLAIGESFTIDKVLDGYDWSQSYEGWTEELRYLLFRYDEWLATQAGETLNPFQWNKIWEADASKSIEHIQPQSTAKSYVDNIGNLTMLPPGLNSSLQDKAPRDKAQNYVSAGIRATVEVGSSILSSGQWNASTVMERARAIEEFVRQEWRD